MEFTVGSIVQITSSIRPEFVGEYAEITEKGPPSHSTGENRWYLTFLKPNLPSHRRITERNLRLVSN